MSARVHHTQCWQVEVLQVCAATPTPPNIFSPSRDGRQQKVVPGGIRHCQVQNAAHPPHQTGPGPQLFRVLLRNIKFPGQSVPFGKAGQQLRLWLILRVFCDGAGSGSVPPPSCFPPKTNPIGCFDDQWLSESITSANFYTFTNNCLFLVWILLILILVLTTNVNKQCKFSQFFSKTYIDAQKQ